MHDAITIGVPVLAILFGILWNQQGLRDVRGEIKDVRGEVKDFKNDVNSRFSGLEARLDRMQADLSMFYRVLGEHGKSIEFLEKK